MTSLKTTQDYAYGKSWGCRDTVIGQLVPLMEKGDILIDGGIPL